MIVLTELQAALLIAGVPIAVSVWAGLLVSMMNAEDERNARRATAALRAQVRMRLGMLRDELRRVEDALDDLHADPEEVARVARLLGSASATGALAREMLTRIDEVETVFEHAQRRVEGVAHRAEFATTVEQWTALRDRLDIEIEVEEELRWVHALWRFAARTGKAAPSAAA